MNQTPHEEKVIERAMNLLQAKHDLEPVEQYCHYVVEGEDEQECDSEDYCEKCIGKGVRKHRDEWLQKRGRDMSVLRQMKKDGYFVFWKWNNEFECMALAMHIVTDKETRKYEKEIKNKYKEGLPLYSYRYYQKGSESSSRMCDNCGIIISACITADHQEIEHWEEYMEDGERMDTMGNQTAYELYEIFQFIHQAEDDVYKRGIALAEKLLMLNGELSELTKE